MQVTEVVKMASALLLSILLLLHSYTTLPKTNIATEKLSPFSVGNASSRWIFRGYVTFSGGGVSTCSLFIYKKVHLVHVMFHSFVVERRLTHFRWTCTNQALICTHDISPQRWLCHIIYKYLIVLKKWAVAVLISSERWFDGKKVCENNLRFWQEHNLPVTPHQSWQTTPKIFPRFDTTRETLAPSHCFHSNMRVLYCLA